MSGSEGNSIAVGGADSYVLIDAGTSAKRIVSALAEREFDVSRLAAIFVTHEHSDHISALRVLAGRYNLPVYGTAGTLCALEATGGYSGADLRTCPTDGVSEGGIHVRPFRTMHDTIESCGYIVTTADGRRVAIATDTGCVTNSMREAIRGCDLVYIESNHDVDMLRCGPYPYHLKQRIFSDRGHLSNDSCAAELAELAKNGTSRFILAHLSRENNRPDIAESTSKRALAAAGLRERIDYTLDVASPMGLPMMIF